MTEQGIYMMFPVIMTPVQSLESVDIHVIPVVAGETSARCAVTPRLFVEIARFHHISLVNSQRGAESEIFQEFGLQITVHVNIVVNALVDIIMSDFNRVVLVGHRRSRLTQRRIYHSGTVVDQLISGIIAQYLAVFIVSPNGSQHIVIVEPDKNILVRITRVASPTGTRRLHCAAAVRHVDTGSQPFCDLRVDITTNIVAVKF